MRREANTVVTQKRDIHPGIVQPTSRPWWVGLSKGGTRGGVEKEGRPGRGLGLRGSPYSMMDIGWGESDMITTRGLKEVRAMLRMNF